MICVLKMEAQPALHIIGSASKANQTDLVFKGFLQCRIQQQKISSRDIILQAQGDRKLELVIADDRATANQFIIFVDCKPRAVDHGKIFQ